MKNLLFYLIVILLLFTLYGSFDLSYGNLTNKIACPKVFGIPACYIVFVAFLGTFVSHVLKLDRIWFYSFLFLPFGLATGASLAELLGYEVCPRTSTGIPMCFISAVFCYALLFLKLWANRIIKQ